MKKNIHARAGARKNRPNTFKTFSRAGLRLRNLERVIRDRHGGVPDTDDVDAYLIQVAHCYRQMAVDRGSRVTVAALMKTFGFWCEEKAPLVCREQVEQIARDVIEIGIFPIDDACGQAIRLTYAERTRARATAIGSIDADWALRNLLAKERRRERDRLRDERKRRAKGAVPRAIYEANSLSKTEPWKAMGISKRTWERRRKKAAEAVASPSPHSEQVDASPSPHPSYKGGATCDMQTASEQRRASGRRRAEPIPVETMPVTGGVVIEGEINTDDEVVLDDIRMHPSLQSALAWARHLIEKERHQ